jgi:hypothetical protein
MRRVQFQCPPLLAWRYLGFRKPITCERVSRTACRGRGECKNTRARCVSVILDRGAGTDWLRISQRGGRSVQSAMEGAAGQMLVPILGIVAVAAVTFYTVSFMEMRDVRFAFPFPVLLSLPPVR